MVKLNKKEETTELAYLTTIKILPGLHHGQIKGDPKFCKVILMLKSLKSGRVCNREVLIKQDETHGFIKSIMGDTKNFDKDYTPELVDTNVFRKKGLHMSLKKDGCSFRKVVFAGTDGEEIEKTIQISLKIQRDIGYGRFYDKHTLKTMLNSEFTEEGINKRIEKLQDEIRRLENRREEITRIRTLDA